MQCSHRPPGAGPGCPEAFSLTMTPGLGGHLPGVAKCWIALLAVSIIAIIITVTVVAIENQSEEEVLEDTAQAQTAKQENVKKNDEKNEEGKENVYGTTEVKCHCPVRTETPR